MTLTAPARHCKARLSKGMKFFRKSNRGLHPPQFQKNAACQEKFAIQSPCSCIGVVVVPDASNQAWEECHVVCTTNSLGGIIKKGVLKRCRFDPQVHSAFLDNLNRACTKPFQ
eukprot:78385-Amphidinium_carterae.1